MAAFEMNQNTIGNQAVSNQMLPAEGPKAVPITFDFSVNEEYRVQLQNMQALGRFSLLQTMYVDNSLNTFDVTVLVTVLRQKIIVRAGVQGYFPVLSPNPIDVQVSSVGSVASCMIFFLNFPLASVWWQGTTP